MSTATLPNIDPKLFDKSKWTDRVIIAGAHGAASIFSQGFLVIPYSVVLDTTLSETAFKLLCFYSGIASRGTASIPPEDTQLNILGMDADRFNAAKKQLIEHGLISIENGHIKIKFGDAA